MVCRLMSAVAMAALVAFAGPAGAAERAISDYSDAELRASVEDGLFSSGGTDILRDVRDLFPEEWNAFMRQTVLLMRQGDMKQMATASADFMRGFIARHSPSKAKAPTPELMAMAGAGATLARTLRAENVDACVSFVWGGGDMGGGREKLSPKANASFDNYQPAMIAAMAAGERTPTVHPALSAADEDALIKALIEAGADEKVGASSPMGVRTPRRLKPARRASS